MQTLELCFDPRCKHLKIHRHLAADLPPINMVPEAIQQVLVILIANALDAMEATPNPTLSIRTSAPGNPPKFAVIEITDNGTGITTTQCPASSTPSSPPNPSAKDGLRSFNQLYPHPKQAWHHFLQVSPRPGHHVHHPFAPHRPFPRTGSPRNPRWKL